MGLVGGADWCRERKEKENRRREKENEEGQRKNAAL